MGHINQAKYVNRAFKYNLIFITILLMKGNVNNTIFLGFLSKSKSI